MALSLEAIVNGKAKQNRGRSSEREERHLRNLLGIFPEARVNRTASENELAKICQRILLQQKDIAFISGGDGAVHYFMTEFFEQAYQEFGNDMLPIEFARKMNSLALDPDSRLHLPHIYHRKRGTVNVYGDTLRMSGDLVLISENIFKANTQHKDKGVRAFRRAYVPVLMLYDKEHPENLKHVQLMTLYADGFLFNVFQEYYKPKDRGGSSGMTTAMKLIARSSASIGLDMIVPRGGLVGQLYGKRYIDKILKKIEGEVCTEDSTIVQKGHTRNAIAIGSMGANIYGLRPFHRMPCRPADFSAYFAPGMPEYRDLLNPERYSFHLLAGNPDPVNIVKKLPLIYMNMQTGIPNMTDTLAKRVEIEQSEVLEFIADGSRHSDGQKIVIEIAYLQPFILLDKPPME